MTREASSALWGAISDQDDEAVGNALALGACVDQVIPGRGVSAVGYAAEVGTAAIVARLLAHGGAPNLVPGARSAPLERAVSSRQDAPEKVELLLRAGASVGQGFPLLHAARRGGAQAVRVVTLLLDAGAPVDQRAPSNEWTALHHAACAANVPLIELLMERGARTDLAITFDIEQANLSPGMTPPDIARQYNSDSFEESIAVIVKELEIDCTWEGLRATLGDAARTREGAIAAALVLARRAGDASAQELLTDPDYRPFIDELLARPEARFAWVERTNKMLALMNATPIPSPPLTSTALVGAWRLTTSSLLSADAPLELEAPHDLEAGGGSLRFTADGKFEGELQGDVIEGTWTLEGGLLAIASSLTGDQRDINVRWSSARSRLYLDINDDHESELSSYGLEKVAPPPLA